MFKKIAILLLGLSGYCFGSAAEAWFCNLSWDYAVVNLEDNSGYTGDMCPKGPYYDPWDFSWSGRQSKSITLDSSGVPYFINAKTSTVCCLDVATETYSSVVSIAGAKTIEVSNDGIYAMTSSSLYKYSFGTVSKQCDISGYSDIAVSPSGRVIGLASTGTAYGLYEIDPTTGSAACIINNPYYSGSSHANVNAYDSGTLVKLSKVTILDICFSNDGDFWMRAGDCVYQVDLDTVLTASSSSSWNPYATRYSYVNAVELCDVPINYGYSTPSQSFDVYVTPEPLSAMLMLTGGLLVMLRRK